MQSHGVAKRRDGESEGGCNTKCMQRPTSEVYTNMAFDVDMVTFWMTLFMNNFTNIVMGER